MHMIDISFKKLGHKNCSLLNSMNAVLNKFSFAYIKMETGKLASYVPASYGRVTVRPLGKFCGGELRASYS